MKNISLVFFERIFCLVISLLISIIVARYYGPTESGKLQTVIALSMLLKVFSDLGLQHFITKDLIKKAYPWRRFSSALTLQAIGWFLYVLLFLGGISLIGYPQEYLNIALVLCGVVLFERYYLFQSILQARGRFNYIAVSNVFGYVSSLLFVWLAAENGWGITIVVFYLFIQSFCQFLLSALFSVFEDGGVRIETPRLKVAKKLLLRSSPFIMSSIVYSIYMRVDVIMVDYFLGATEAGLYSAASKLIIPLAFLGQVLVQVYYPKMISLYSTSMVDYATMIYRLTAIGQVLSLIIIASIFFTADWLVVNLYGAEFISSAWMMVVLSFVLLFNITSPVFSRILVIENLGKFELVKTSLAAVINLALNFYWIPIYGAAGAAAATVVAYAISDMLAFCLFRKTRHIFAIYWKAIFMSVWRMSRV
jgi:O-antigen/teichoic acid export membrane protein